MAGEWGPAGGWSAPPPAEPDLDDERPWFADRSVEARARLLAEVMGEQPWTVSKLVSKLAVKRPEREPFAAVLRGLAKRCDLTEFGLGYLLSDEGQLWFDESAAGVPVAPLDWSDRARVVLEHLKVRTLGDLSERSAEQVLSHRSGKKCLGELIGTLQRYGLGLAKDGEAVEIEPDVIPAPRAKKAIEPQPATCEECGKAYEIRRPDMAGPHALSYCLPCRRRIAGREHMQKTRSRRRAEKKAGKPPKAKPEPEPEPRTCGDCGKTYVLKRIRQAGETALRFCRDCRQRAYQRTYHRKKKRGRPCKPRPPKAPAPAAASAQRRAESENVEPPAAETKAKQARKGAAIESPKEKDRLARLRMKLLEAENVSLRARLGEVPVDDVGELVREALELTDELIGSAA